MPISNKLCFVIQIVLTIIHMSLNFLKTRQLPLAGLTGTQLLCVGSGVAVDPVGRIFLATHV